MSDIAVKIMTSVYEGKRRLFYDSLVLSQLFLWLNMVLMDKLFQVVDETDRLLREAYQSWLPTVLQLTQSNDESLFPYADSFLSSTFGSLKTIRRL